MGKDSKNEEQFFVDLRQNIKNLNHHLGDVNTNLNHLDIEPISLGKGQGSLEKQFKKNPEGVGAFGPVDNFIQEAVRITDTINEYTQDYSKVWNIQQDKVNKTRKAERKDMWVLWFQKLVRWSLGTLVAVILYSGAVWASENYDFIKVPIKDWIPKVQ